VKLRSLDGACVEISVLGYQFDEPDPVELDLEDDEFGPEDWLTVHAQIEFPDERRWEFTQPCLTTLEARALADWLAAVAAGSVPTEGRVFQFTEPNVAFSVLSHPDDRAAAAGRLQLRMHFSYESLPPWRQPYRAWPNDLSYFIVLDVDRDQVHAAATAWLGQISPFPTRVPLS
jgi:hypothetical protein